MPVLPQEGSGYRLRIVLDLRIHAAEILIEISAPWEAAKRAACAAPRINPRFINAIIVSTTGRGNWKMRSSPYKSHARRSLIT